MKAVAKFTCGTLLLFGVIVTGAGCSDESTTAPEEQQDSLQDAELSDASAQEPPDSAIAQDVPKDTGFARVGKCVAGPKACDDNNPCTNDGCDPNTGCYSTPKDCSDDDLCTVDTCDINSGDCKHVENTCDDGNKCTSGSCVPKQGCAYSPTDCSDDDACTSDGCSPLVGCINNKMSCDDGITCTVDSCDTKSGCAHIKAPGAQCCEQVGDCEDDNVCTVHACVGGVCETSGVFGCCDKNADCDDGHSCTTDSCDQGSGLCSNTFEAGPGCCLIDTECDDNDSCTLDRCEETKCAHEVRCCDEAKDCNPEGVLGLCAEATCTEAGCGVTYKSGAGCCNKDVQQTGFEAGDKWGLKLVPSLKGDWAIDDKASVGGGTAAAGSASLYYMSSDKPIAGGHNSARAMLDEVELPTGTSVALTFQLRSSLLPGSAGDVLVVRAKTQLGTWIIWKAKSSALGWTEIKVDLSGLAARPGTRNVRLIFELLPAKQSGSKSWVRVDELKLSSDCSNKTCASDADCSDGLAATQESCSEETCVYQIQTKYCESSVNCDDKNLCTSDVCLDLVCQNNKLPGCCLKSSECKDDNPCTLDYCSSHKCKHLLNKPAPTCCYKVAECDDGNPCTIDTCPTVGLACAYTKTSPDCCAGNADCDDSDKCTLDLCLDNKCTHDNQCCKTAADCDDGDDQCTEDKCSDEGLCVWLPTGATGCCENEIMTLDFEDGTTAGLTLKNSAPATSRWQAVKGKRAKTGKGALYYGNLAKGNFDDGKTNGTVTTGPITLPSGEKLSLTFSLWMDTETSTTYDKFEVWVLWGSKKFKIWHKGLVVGGFKTKTWLNNAVDLSAFSGEKIQLQFLFDTTDSIGNTGEGVYLDAIELTRPCAKQTCAKNSDCDDKLKESLDQCSAGACVFSFK